MIARKMILGLMLAPLALAFGCSKPMPEPAPAGTGVILHYAGQEFVVTALHVAKQCDFNPLIDYKGDWTNSSWRTIGVSDDITDIAVLQRVGSSDSKIARLSARYGTTGTTFGAASVALGFPVAAPESVEWSRRDDDQRPVPIGAPLTLYFAPGDIQYSGGYLNHGFSGGPVVAWSGGNSTITGIITRKLVTKATYDNKTRTEHAGLVAFAAIEVAERILAEHMGHSQEEIGIHKPQPFQNRLPQPATLVTAEIMNSVVRLGCASK